MRKVRKYVKGERHHWWPESLSQYWVNSRGVINRISTTSEIIQARPNKFAKISDGHNTQFSGPSPWDSTFENEYDNADSNFPTVVDWLGELTQMHQDRLSKPDDVHSHHQCTDKQFGLITECLSSLVIRSPKYREYAVSLAEHIRGPLPKRERNNLISANLRHKHPDLSKTLASGGKIVVIFSQSKEFIYGDGFYQNIPVSDVQMVIFPKILVPITPAIAVLYVRPTRYGTMPRIMTRNAEDNLVEFINNTTQTYSKDWLFYRNDKPVLQDYFLQNKHLIYGEPDQINQLIWQIPGVHKPRNYFSDF